MVDETPRTIHVRIEPAIRARLDAYCARERRSLTNAVNKLLDDALTADGDWVVDPERTDG